MAEGDDEFWSLLALELRLLCSAESMSVRAEDNADASVEETWPEETSAASSFWSCWSGER